MRRKAEKKIISRRNAGIGDLLLATAHAWYFAEKTGRTLEICWAPSQYFNDKSQNAFCKFFVIPDKIGTVNIISKEKVGRVESYIRRLPLYPLRYFLLTMFAEVTVKLLRNRIPEWIKTARNKRRNYLINLIKEGKDIKNKTIVLNTHFNFLPPAEIKPFFDALKLKPELQESVDAFTQKFFLGKFVIGAHVRYYNPANAMSSYTPFWISPEESLDRISQRLNSIITEKADNNYVLYLATNSDIVYNYLKEKFVNVVVFGKDFLTLKSNWALHSKMPENSFRADLVEMFLLAKCNVLYRFPPVNSWFSYYGSLYVEEAISE